MSAFDSLILSVFKATSAALIKNTWIIIITLNMHFQFFFIFFLAFDFLSVLHGHSGCSIPATTANDLRLQWFLSQILSIIFIFQYFPFLCSVLNKGTTWYHFYNVFGMTRSLTGDWARDLPHLKPALYSQ